MREFTISAGPGFHSPNENTLEEKNSLKKGQSSNANKPLLKKYLKRYPQPAL